MSKDSNTIPNIQVQHIGTGKKPHSVIKGFVELPCWNGYYLYDESYALKKNKTVTNGAIELWVDGMVNKDGTFFIDPEQINSYIYLVENQEGIKHAILNALKKELPLLMETEYASWDLEEEWFPKLADLTPEFDFKNYIGPESITIGEDVKDGIAYITWRFRCRWDIEHGLDIITHKERVIEIAPEADPWKISKDNGTYEEEQKEFANKVWKLPKKKKWWQFW